MNLSIGIIGLPNVGKSTLFNALLKKQQALAANYPFATIEPNVGVVPVPDSRLAALAAITKDEMKMSDLPPIKPATVEFYDIAGLVKGASQGEGLGNKFLSHIRETKIIAHVVRAFEDPDVIKEGAVDPKSDYEVINAELILADLATAQNAQSKVKKFTTETEKETIRKLIDGLNSGKPAREISFSDEENDYIKTLFLLSSKPEIVVLNLSEDQYNPVQIDEMLNEYARGLSIDRENMIAISAKIESELASLSPDEQKEYLGDLGLSESGLERLIRKSYEELGLVSFLTSGEKEVKAWTIKKGMSAQNAAGEIHNDFIKKFIKAEVVSYDDYVEFGGWKGAREKGKARLEGRDYVMKDGDVVEFKIGN
jgi:ribosome-binding ATPase